jgi:hypothetical protein
MKRHNLLLLAVAGILSAGLAVRYAPEFRRHARADSVPTLLELVPADATLLAYADVATLRDLPLVRYLLSMAGPATVDKDYADFIGATGFDYQRDLDSVVLASRLDPSAQTLVFAEGRFDRARIARYALRSGKLHNENGHAIYVTPSNTPGKNISIAFLADNRIALSEGGDLTAALAAQPTSKLDPALRERVSRVEGSPLFIVAKTPASASANPSGAAGEQGNSVGAIWGSLRWVDLAARPDGRALLLSAEGECSSPGEAQKIASSLELVRGMLHGGLSDPKSRGQMPAETAAEANRLLQAIRVSTEGERVRLLLTVTPEMLGTLKSPNPGASAAPAQK